MKGACKDDKCDRNPTKPVPYGYGQYANASAHVFVCLHVHAYVHINRQEHVLPYEYYF